MAAFPANKIFVYWYPKQFEAIDGHFCVINDSCHDRFMFWGRLESPSIDCLSAVKNYTSDSWNVILHITKFPPKYYIPVHGGLHFCYAWTEYEKLENSPKKARTLIGCKSCLYDSMETELAHAFDGVMVRAKRIYALII